MKFVAFESHNNYHCVIETFKTLQMHNSYLIELTYTWIKYTLDIWICNSNKYSNTCQIHHKYMLNIYSDTWHIHSKTINTRTHIHKKSYNVHISNTFSDTSLVQFIHKVDTPQNIRLSELVKEDIPRIRTQSQRHIWNSTQDLPPIFDSTFELTLDIRLRTGTRRLNLNMIHQFEF